MSAIPAGYKQTAIGVLPEDWNVKAVHEFGSIKTGPFGTLLKASEYSAGDGVPVISVGEIRQGFLQISDHTPRVSKVVTRRLPQYVLKTGDIVFGRKGGVDRSALIRPSQNGWFLGSDGISIRPSQDIYDEYLGVQFQSARVQGWLVQNAIGTTMPSLNQTILRNVVIPLPPTKAEQEAIAEALSDADTLIESLEQLLTKKRHLKQATMQELLTGKKRLPGFSGEWGLKRLGEMFDAFAGGDFDPSRSSSVHDARHPFPIYSNALTDLGLYGFCSYGTYPADTITVTARGTLGAANYRDHPYTAIGRVLVLQPKQELDSRFFAEFINNRINFVVESTGVPQLTAPQISNCEVLTPTIEEQTAVANTLLDMDAELDDVEAQIAKTRALKQGMMQKLLTGEIRLL